MKVIGLTGGIGAGKSTVSGILAELGYRIIDADLISHQITQKGSATLERIAHIFGEDMVLPDGNLDRKKLAGVVFSDKEKLRMLEEMTTREVVEIIGMQLQQLHEKECEELVFVDAPLLFESGADKLTDLVFTVDADLETRIRRVMERDGASRQEIEKRIASQMSSAQKAALSAEVIDNSKGKEELRAQVEYLLEKYAETNQRE